MRLVHLTLFLLAAFHDESVSTIFMPIFQEADDGRHAICGHLIWQ